MYPPLSAKGFLAKWFSVKGVGGGYPLNGQNPLSSFWQVPLVPLITSSLLLSGKVVFMMISKQETLATAACFHYVTNYPRACVPIRSIETTECWTIPKFSQNCYDSYFTIRLLQYDTLQESFSCHFHKFPYDNTFNKPVLLYNYLLKMACTFRTTDDKWSTEAITWLIIWLSTVDHLNSLHNSTKELLL